jgi:hypothetical protein
MTIVRSLGVTTLVALMSAHRAVYEHGEAAGKSFDQATVQAIEAYLRYGPEPEVSGRNRSTETPPSYN